ncbi:MAG: FHA domain-containing protein [Planctomycetes bacterium]|nr:FHA domain-containing protein [Planctomycetota bacterium]
MSSTHTPRIVLSLVGDGPVPRTWSSSCHLRVGRLPELEIALDDMSVSRIHAEVLLDDGGWVVRDKGSSNGTSLNGVRIGRTAQPVRQGDVIRTGNLAFKIEHLQVRPVVVRVGQQTVPRVHPVLVVSLGCGCRSLRSMVAIQSNR